MDVQLLDESSRKPLAMLFDVDHHSSLSEVREIIVDQVSEVIPSNEYMFIHHGTAVCRRQEPELTVEKTTLKSDDALFCILPLSFSQVQTSTHILTETGHSVSKSESSAVSDLLNSKPCTSLAVESDVSDHSCEAGNSSDDAEGGSKQFIHPYSPVPTKQKSHDHGVSESVNLIHECPTPETKLNREATILKLRSPSTAELRNLKIFSPTEIENGKGKEPEYRRFWNKTVQELAKDKISNKEIYKRVNDKWNLHRCKLLELETEELQEKSKNIEATPSDSLAESHSQEHKMKKITLPNNIKRVREASRNVEGLDEEVRILVKSLKRRHDMDQSQKKEIQENLKKAKIRLDSSKSELRKAQDSLRKNLGVKKSELSKYV